MIKHKLLNKIKKKTDNLVEKATLKKVTNHIIKDLNKVLDYIEEDFGSDNDSYELCEAYINKYENFKESLN